MEKKGEKNTHKHTAINKEERAVSNWRTETKDAERGDLCPFALGLMRNKPIKPTRHL